MQGSNTWALQKAQPTSAHPSCQPHTLPDLSTFILPHLTIPLPQPCFLSSREGAIKLWLPPLWIHPASLSLPQSWQPLSGVSHLREAGEEGETQAHLLLLLPQGRLRTVVLKNKASPHPSNNCDIT